MKTPVTVLQEMMVKTGETASYECTSQTGPQHLASFEYRCSARGVTRTASARSKKEAKQESARLVLAALSERGERVPEPVLCVGSAGPSDGDTRSHVALLKELCEEFRLPAPEYTLVGDTGPPHQRHFTVRASVGSHARVDTATTKKAARQRAFNQLYAYLRENLARLTKDFDEEVALSRAHERAMERYLETREEPRPDLGQRVADYHMGLAEQYDAEKRGAALECLERAGSPERAVCAAAEALGATVSWCTLPGAELHVLQLAPSAPTLAFAARLRQEAARRAVKYLKRALRTDM